MNFGEMSKTQQAKRYWVCEKCGEGVSPKPRKRENRERRHEPLGWNHVHCIPLPPDPNDVGGAEQRRLRRLAIQRDENLGGRR